MKNMVISFTWMKLRSSMKSAIWARGTVAVFFRGCVWILLLAFPFYNIRHHRTRDVRSVDIVAVSRPGSERATSVRTFDTNTTRDCDRRITSPGRSIFLVALHHLFHALDTSSHGRKTIASMYIVVFGSRRRRPHYQRRNKQESVRSLASCNVERHGIRANR